ncbi:MAG: GGDEF domain-containing protein [Spirochaetales bacterium]|nr:GGDEF domain-containing protein [Spirochaetales bacterium]
MPISSDVLTQFNHLEKAGALDALGDLRKENRELERIITEATLLVSYTDVSSMLDYVIARFLDHFIPEFLGFLVHPPRGDALRQYCYRNLKETDETIPEQYYDLLKNYFERTPGRISFEQLVETFGKDTFGKDILTLNPEMVFPMFGIGGLYGIVFLGKKIVGGAYSELEQKYVDRIIRFLSVSMQNGLHYESSITEPKTGLFTHDYFVRRLDEAIARTKRKNTGAGILMLDVDHFKRFNDSWGHVTGDLVLVTLAGVLAHIVREEDCAARFGGEEFSILVADCSPVDLMMIAERIRNAVASIRIPAPDGSQELSVTVSIGARVIESTPGMTSLILIGDADKALYRSKNEGRNRSTLYHQGLLMRAMMKASK